MNRASEYDGRVLEAFNRFAEFKRMKERMWLMIEEICHQVDNGDADGLQPKCVAVMPLWNEYLRFLRDGADALDPDFEGERMGAQMQMILDAGAAGVEPAEIRRRWLLMLPKDRKECSENGRIEAQTRPV
jgi:hypothetical protein